MILHLIEHCGHISWDSRWGGVCISLLGTGPGSRINLKLCIAFKGYESVTKNSVMVLDKVSGKKTRYRVMREL